MFKKLFLITAILLSTIASADQYCELKPEQFHAFMQQDFDTFDQKPTGWRSLYVPSGACDLSIIVLIDSYHQSHQGKLVPWQDRLLTWHVGQSLGFLNLYDLAIARFQNSYDPQELPKPEFHWNAYVRASIAFMNKDRAALQRAHDEFITVAPMESNNFKIVERFIRCFDANYFDAYSGTGKCQ
jgi:hypothetical protein